MKLQWHHPVGLDRFFPFLALFRVHAIVAGEAAMTQHFTTAHLQLNLAPVLPVRSVDGTMIVVTMTTIENVKERRRRRVYNVRRVVRIKKARMVVCRHEDRAPHGYLFHKKGIAFAQKVKPKQNGDNHTQLEPTVSM